MEVAEDPADETKREEKLLEWEREQSILKENVITSDTEPWQNSPDFHGLKRVGGLDLSYLKEDDTSACASLIVLSYPDLEVIYEDYQMVTLDAPYVAGFLAFREVPSLVEAVRRLQEMDANLMPQAKELKNGGDFFYLKGSIGNVLGAALKSTQKSVKPIYISVGHKISLETAVLLVHSCCRYRVPEPTRQGSSAFFTAPVCWSACLSVSKPVKEVMLTWMGSLHYLLDDNYEERRLIVSQIG
ncbi:endonuclease V isoform X4 [Dendrobates tinctorius]|uniref:endonuclease V isoform X4 n=1 Tax=Dendrobates tinctorius TaxID=92724 RepID=UPI003CC92D03